MVASQSDLEARTQTIGRDFYDRMMRFRPSPSEAIEDRIMLLLAGLPQFRSHLLRFIDALAGLDGDRSGIRVRALLHEYLDTRFPNVPVWLQALIPILASEIWPAVLVAGIARLGAKSVASRFIARDGAHDRSDGALRALAYLRRHARYPSFDILGEYVASEHESDAARDRYLALLHQLARSDQTHRRTAGGVPALQISLKLSSLTADFNPIDPAGTVRRIRPRLTQIVREARRLGVGLALDMEQYETRDLIRYAFYEIFGPGQEFADWDGVGVVLQAYLRDSHDEARALLDAAVRRGAPFQVRLVKGAYWDYETVVAMRNGWPIPVWQEKWQTDAAFERLSEALIDAYPHIYLAIASHNIRSHAHAEAAREAAGLPAQAIEHQVLFRTAEGVAQALVALGCSTRDYVPLGDLLPGMAYLVRRILENSSQAGFLLHSRAGESPAALLAPPTPPLPDSPGQAHVT